MAQDTTNYKIFSEYKDIKSNYEGGRLEKISGLYRSQYHVIRMCEFYSDSRYMGTYLGNKKPVGEGQIDVPFYNIVNYRVALAKTATDLDIKDFQIIADNPKYQIQSMLLNRESFEWMKKTEFSKALNLMGSNRPKYGGYLVKKTEEKGDLKIDVVRWTNVYTDQNDILGGPIVEIHHMSPVEIKRKDGIWDNVIDVLKAHKGMKGEDRPSTIDVYEITGEFPVSIFKDAMGKEDTEEDEYTFSLQRHFIAHVNGKDFLLSSDEIPGEMEDYYEYLSWEENGFGLGRGVIEDSEEAQVWTNDAVINESIAMSLAGRVGIKTNSKKLGNNILAHDHGKIYELEDGKDINSFNLVPSALGQYQNQIEKWRTQADNVTSSFDSVTGEQPPAGTPYSQTVLLNQVASRPFDYKREEWGIHLTKMFTKWVIPHLIRKIKREHILVTEFTDSELEMIDQTFAVYNTKKDIIKEVLKGNLPTPEQQEYSINQYKSEIKKQGKKRYIEIPDDFFKDIECKVTVVTTGEQKNKGVILQSLNSILGTVIQSYNPNTGTFGVLEDPELSKIFKEIVELTGTGISPISLGTGRSQAAPQAPQGEPVPSPMESQPLTPA